MCGGVRSQRRFHNLPSFNVLAVQSPSSTAPREPLLAGRPQRRNTNTDNRLRHPPKMAKAGSTPVTAIAPGIAAQWLLSVQVDGGGPRPAHPAPISSRATVVGRRPQRKDRVSPPPLTQ